MTNVLAESSTFQKTAKHFLAEKSKNVSKITLIEYNQIISQDKQFAKIFNKYLVSIPVINMLKNQEFEFSDSPEEDPLSRIIGKYQNYCSIFHSLVLFFMHRSLL